MYVLAYVCTCALNRMLSVLGGSDNLDVARARWGFARFNNGTELIHRYLAADGRSPRALSARARTIAVSRPTLRVV